MQDNIPPIPSQHKLRKDQYERPRCNVILELPFGLFIARRVRIPLVPGCSSPTTEHLSNPK